MGVTHLLVSATAVVFSTTARATSVQTAGNPTSFIKETHYSDDACTTLSFERFTPVNLCKHNMMMAGEKYAEVFDCVGSSSTKSTYKGESCDTLVSTKEEKAGTCDSFMKRKFHCPAFAAPGIRMEQYTDADCSTPVGTGGLNFSPYQVLGLCYRSGMGMESYTFDGTNMYHKRYMNSAVCDGSPTFETIHPCGTCKNWKKFSCNAVTTMTVKGSETSGANVQSTGTSGANGQAAGATNSFIKTTVYSDDACTTAKSESFMPESSCVKVRSGGILRSVRWKCTAGGTVQKFAYMDGACTSGTSGEVKADICDSRKKTHCPAIAAPGMPAEAYSDSSCSTLHASLHIPLGLCLQTGVSESEAYTFDGTKVYYKKYASAGCGGTATSEQSHPCGTCFVDDHDATLYSKMSCNAEKTTTVQQESETSGANVQSATALAAAVLASMAAI